MQNNVIFKKKNNKIFILKDLDWSRKQNKHYSKIHGLSTYLAMFCPALPSYFIKKYTKENDLVMDNFSGRGTTALTARELNRKFIGNDLNPYAFVLSKFKISKVSKKLLLNRISQIENEYNLQKNNYKISKNDDELLLFYSKKTLMQLKFLRDKYGKKWKLNCQVDNAVLAYALSLMHGKMKKNGDTIYFSIDMPNTISMSPNYVKKYANAHCLVRPEICIFQKLKDRINSRYDPIFEKKYDGKVYHHNSLNKMNFVEKNSVDLVITSPPYLNIVNYTCSNWLKLWLLGYERKNLRNEINLSDKFKFNDYCIFIKNYLNNIYPLLKKDAKVCMIVGDVHDQELIENVWKKIKYYVKYKLVEIYYDSKYLQTHKITYMLNNKSGKATKIDKVLVVQKYETRNNNKN